MKKKKPYYLKMYRVWCRTGKLPNRKFPGLKALNANGLCNVHSIDDRELDLFCPIENDFQELSVEGLCKAWWASGLPSYRPNDDLAALFTPLRQTIVLFLAVMNDEL